jgi:catalase
VPGGAASTSAMAASGQTLEFLRDQFRHCKTILLLDEATDLLERGGIPPEAAPGIIKGTAEAIDDAIASFVDALAKHRHFERETDPPAV